jgi:hypothetical protein
MLNSQYIPSYSSNFGGKEELDPMRASIPSPDGSGTDPYWLYPRFGEASDEEGCYVDGIQTSCSTAVNIITSGAGIQCPYSSCGPVYNQRDVNGDGRIDSYWDVFRAHADGSSGYMAMGGIYSGNGRFHMPGTGHRQRPELRSPSSNRSPFGAGSDPEGDNRLSFVDASWSGRSMLFPPPPTDIDTCLEVFGGEAAGLKIGLLNSIPQTGYFGGGSLMTRNVSALEMLQTVSRAETVNGDPNRTISAALLAVVWHGETIVGDFTASANVSESKGKNPGDVDYGPFQLNYNQIKSEVALGLYKIDDLGEKNVFGSKTITPNTAFDGSPSSNMMIAARKLKANGGTQDRNRVKAYVGGTNWDATRRDHFDTYFPKWQSFFNCIK